MEIDDDVLRGIFIRAAKMANYIRLGERPGDFAVFVEPFFQELNDLSPEAKALIRELEESDEYDTVDRGLFSNWMDL